MLDTDTVSYWFRDEGGVPDNIESRDPLELCISAITLAQLRYGARRVRSARLHHLIDDFISEVAVLPFDRDCALTYAIVANELRSAGMPIGDFDALIAAHAKALHLTLVTNNVRHFSRVPNLRVENWL